MRFIFGLIAGALTTLVVATALDAPTEEVLQRADEIADESWQALREQFSTPTSSPSFSKTDTEIGAQTEMSLDAARSLYQPPNSQEPPIEQIPADHEHITPPEGDQPVNLPITDLAAVDTWVAPSTPELTDAVNKPSVALNVEAVAASQAGEAVVWSPFHSEASATGFANRLSRQLAHPFEVRKQGPANYIVVYSFADENQRLALQREISKVTGVSS